MTSSNLDGYRTVQYGETSEARTIYTLVSSLCLLVLAFMLGSRSRQLRIHTLRTMNLIRFLVVLLSVLSIAFVVSAAIVESGLGLSSKGACRSAILICLVFYVSSKSVMYIFLTERAHALRAPYLRRTRDWIWMCGISTIAIVFGAIAIVAFIFPISELSATDGKCRIGLPLRATIPLLTFDCIINAGLTITFLYFVRPLLDLGPYGPGSAPWTKRLADSVRRALGVEQSSHLSVAGLVVHGSNPVLLKAVERLVWKSLVGAGLVLIPTVANLGLLYRMQGRELGWLCFTICTLDVTWAACVIHWLTVEPIEVETGSLQRDSASSGSLGAGIAL